MDKFTPKSPDSFIKKDEDATLAKFGHINALVEEVNTLAPAYTVYSAILDQSGVNPPTPRDLDYSAGSAFQDTIGGTWSYLGVGEYLYTKTGAFTTIEKVAVILSDNRWNMGADNVVVVEKYNNNSLIMKVGTVGAFASPSPVTLADGKLYMQFIEIRIYN
jgi:hypothetical protein